MDFLPKQVPMNCDGHFSEVETYLLNHYNCCGLRDKFVGVVFVKNMEEIKKKIIKRHWTFLML